MVRGGRPLIDWLHRIERAPVADTLDVLVQLRRWTFFTTLPPRDGVFAELTSTGGLSLIQSVELRRALVRYYSWLDHIQPIEDYMERTGTFESRDDFLEHIDPVAWARLGIAFAERDADEDVVEELRRELRDIEGGAVDFDALGQDPDVRAGIAKIAENRAIQALLYRLAVDRAVEVLGLIENEIEPATR